jgi:hypothetical protein
MSVHRLVGGRALSGREWMGASGYCSPRPSKKPGRTLGDGRPCARSSGRDGQSRTSFGALSALLDWVDGQPSLAPAPPAQRRPGKFLGEDHRHSTAQVAGSARNNFWRPPDRSHFALRASPPEVLARPRGFPRWDWTPFRCRWLGSVMRTTQRRRSQRTKRSAFRRDRRARSGRWSRVLRSQPRQVHLRRCRGSRRTGRAAPCWRCCRLRR